MIRKVSPLVKSKISGVFVNILTADHKYHVWYCENLLLPIQTILSEKQKTLSQFFVPFLEFSANFKHFQKKKVATANEFAKLQNVKDLVRPHSEKRCLRTSFDSPHVKASQTFVRSA